MSGTFDPVCALVLSSEPEIDVIYNTGVYCTTYIYLNKFMHLSGKRHITKALMSRVVCLMSFACFSVPKQSENMTLAQMREVLADVPQ